MPGERHSEKSSNEFQIHIQPPERLLRGMDNLGGLLKSVQDLGRRVGELEVAVVRNQLDPIFRDLALLRDGVMAARSHLKKDSPEHAPEGITSILDLVQIEIQTILHRYGVVVVESVGGPFDGDVHQIVEIVDADIEENESVILEIRKPGYVFEGRLLRTAEVVVARKQSLSEEGTVK